MQSNKINKSKEGICFFFFFLINPKTFTLLIKVNLLKKNLLH